MAIFIDVAKMQKIRKSSAIKTRCLVSKNASVKLHWHLAVTCQVLNYVIASCCCAFCFSSFLLCRFYFLANINFAIFYASCIAILLLLTSFDGAFWSGCDDIYQMRTQKLPEVHVSIAECMLHDW